MNAVLTLSLLLNVALFLLWMGTRCDLHLARAAKDEAFDVNKSLLDESFRRGVVIESLRQDCRTWREVAGQLRDQLRLQRAS
jgi:hypothetical protein